MDCVIPDEVHLSEIDIEACVAPLPADTKSVKNKWERGDIINVWMDSTPFGVRAMQGPDFTLTYDGIRWMASKLRSDVSLTKTEGVLFGFYEGSNSAFTDLSFARYDGFGQYYIYYPYILIGGNTIGRIPYLTLSFSDGEYFLNHSTGMLEAIIDGWLYDTDFQLVVNGLEWEEGRYHMYGNSRSDIYTPYGISFRNGISCFGSWSSKYSPIVGISNPDGVAFLGMIGSTKEKDYSLTVVDYSTGAEYVINRRATSLDSHGGQRLVAVKVDRDSFMF